MMSEWDTATAVLRLSAQLVDGVQAGTEAAGFADIRPVHGFVFALVSTGPTTAAQLADHLGVSKQAAAQLVAHLEERGYLARHPDPDDRRALRLVLTAKGHACTQAAQAAASAVVSAWRVRLRPVDVRGFDATLATLAEPGRLRPSW